MMTRIIWLLLQLAATLAAGYLLLILLFTM